MSRPMLALGLVSALLVTTIGIAASWAWDREAEVSRRTNQHLVLELGLTDLAIWSEATYCRHPSQADRFAAWADHPMALEHYPAGSMVAPLPAEAPVIGARGRGR